MSPNERFTMATNIALLTASKQAHCALVGLHNGNYSAVFCFKADPVHSSRAPQWKLALSSASKQTHCALVVCDSESVNE